MGGVLAHVMDASTVEMPPPPPLPRLLPLPQIIPVPLAPPPLPLKPFDYLPLGCPLLSMFGELLVGLQCHPSELIGREEEEELVQARKSLPLLTSRCKLTNNGSPQEPLP